MENDKSTQVNNADTDATQKRSIDQTDKRIPEPRLNREDPSSAVTQARDTDQTLPSSADAEATRIKPNSVRPSDRTATMETQARDTAVSSARTTKINTALHKLYRTGAVDRRLLEQYKDKTILKERFVLLRELGRGGMGNVYLAKDLLREEMEDSDSLIAIKVLNEECRRLPGALQSLQREAKKAQTLSHPNIVTVYDFDRDGETAFITMEFIDGKSIKDYLRIDGAMPVEKAYYVIERVARGLAYAHQQGYAHADIKPANIFLADNGTVKILDFGIAKAFTEVKEKRSLADTLTDGAITPAYASLEMINGQNALPVDDIYSLACTFYELISKRHPFLGEDGRPMPANVALEKGAKFEPLPNVPRRYTRAMRKGLEFERAKRFKDAGEFLDAIKPRNIKKDLSLLALAACVTGVIIFATNAALDRVVPSISSLKPELASVAQAISEGDEFLSSQDIDLAHRLYSQAWELANDLTGSDIAEKEKVHSILQDRMNKVGDLLIQRSRGKDVDEYELRELYVALEFLAKDEVTSNKRRINSALDDIERRLKKLESRN